MKFNYPISDRKIKIALVGCGRIANNHLKAIKQHESRLQLVGVCDTNEERLGQATEAYQVEGYTHLTHLLDNTDADVVTVCTPSGLHPEHVIQIAESGRHVVTEKPMATRWSDGLSMVQACDKAGVKLFVVKQNRRNQTLQLVKKAVEQKRFGKIHLAQLNVFWTRPQDYYSQDDWRGTWEYDGGALMNQASHYIDLLHWLIGPVQSIQAMTATLSREIEAEDSGVINLRWRNGALGSVAVTMLTYPQNMEGSITILGEKGSVKVGGVAVNRIDHWDFEDERPEDNDIVKANYETTSVYGFGHPLYYDNVIQVLQGKAKAETDGREGLRSLELLIAAYRSSRDGVTVSLPLEL